MEVNSQMDSRAPNCQGSRVKHLGKPAKGNLVFIFARNSTWDLIEKGKSTSKQCTVRPLLPVMYYHYRTLPGGGRLRMLKHQYAGSLLT